MTLQCGELRLAKGKQLLHAWAITIKMASNGREQEWLQTFEPYKNQLENTARRTVMLAEFGLHHFPKQHCFFRGVGDDGQIVQTRSGRSTGVYLMQRKWWNHQSRILQLSSLCMATRYAHGSNKRGGWSQQVLSPLRVWLWTLTQSHATHQLGALTSWLLRPYHEWSGEREIDTGNKASPNPKKDS